MIHIQENFRLKVRWIDPVTLVEKTMCITCENNRPHMFKALKMNRMSQNSRASTVHFVGSQRILS